MSSHYDQLSFSFMQAAADEDWNYNSLKMYTNKTPSRNQDLNNYLLSPAEVKPTKEAYLQIIKRTSKLQQSQNTLPPNWQTIQKSIKKVNLTNSATSKQRLSQSPVQQNYVPTKLSQHVDSIIKHEKSKQSQSPVLVQTKEKSAENAVIQIKLEPQFKQQLNEYLAQLKLQLTKLQGSYNSKELECDSLREELKQIKLIQDKPIILLEQFTQTDQNFDIRQQSNEQKVMEMELQLSSAKLTIQNLQIENKQLHQKVIDLQVLTKEKDEKEIQSQLQKVMERIAELEQVKVMPNGIQEPLKVQILHQKMQIESLIKELILAKSSPPQLPAFGSVEQKQRELTLETERMKKEWSVKDRQYQVSLYEAAKEIADLKQELVRVLQQHNLDIQNLLLNQLQNDDQAKHKTLQVGVQTCFAFMNSQFTQTEIEIKSVQIQCDIDQQTIEQCPTVIYEARLKLTQTDFSILNRSQFVQTETTEVYNDLYQNNIVLKLPSMEKIQQNYQYEEKFEIQAMSEVEEIQTYYKANEDDQTQVRFRNYELNVEEQSSSKQSQMEFEFIEENNFQGLRIGEPQFQSNTQQDLTKKNLVYQEITQNFRKKLPVLDFTLFEGDFSPKSEAEIGNSVFNSGRFQLSLKDYLLDHESAHHFSALCKLYQIKSIQNIGGELLPIILTPDAMLETESCTRNDLHMFIKFLLVGGTDAFSQQKGVEQDTPSVEQSFQTKNNSRSNLQGATSPTALYCRSTFESKNEGFKS